jgi:hypothetical protein
MQRQKLLYTSNCNDLQEQVSAIIAHSLTQTEFEDMVFAYFGKIPTNNPMDLPTTIYPVNQIVDGVSHANGCDDYINFNDADMTRKDNSDVKFKIITPVAGAVRGMDYSMTLFNGLLGVFSIKTFEFYKALTNTGNTVCFRTVLNTGIILYWDVSVRVPFL